MRRRCRPHLVLQLARALDFLFAQLAGIEFAWETDGVLGVKLRSLGLRVLVTF
jgi:hypothetical protein